MRWTWDFSHCYIQFNIFDECKRSNLVTDKIYKRASRTSVKWSVGGVSSNRSDMEDKQVVSTIWLFVRSCMWRNIYSSKRNSSPRFAHIENEVEITPIFCKYESLNNQIKKVKYHCTMIRILLGVGIKKIPKKFHKLFNSHKKEGSQFYTCLFYVWSVITPKLLIRFGCFLNEKIILHYSIPIFRIGPVPGQNWTPLIFYGYLRNNRNLANRLRYFSLG